MTAAAPAPRSSEAGRTAGAARRRRRRRDTIIGLAIAVACAIGAGVIYLTGDARATTLVTVPAISTPAPAADVPAALAQAWSLPTDAATGTAVSAYGVVVTSTTDGVTAHDPTTGATLWSYTRSNVQLCQVGTADTAIGSASFSGVVTVFAEHGWCSQVTDLDPNTGDRRVQRTSPLHVGGTLLFGGGYAGWVSSDLLELWDENLYYQIRYGDVPNPTQPLSDGGSHPGCTFSDAAVADTQFATVEHCTRAPGVARVVLNWDDPKDSPGTHDPAYSNNNSFPRVTIDTGSPTALIVGVTADRVAALVTVPQPEVVVYDVAGHVVSRTPVDIPASAIQATAAAGITPSVVYGWTRFSLVDGYLVADTTQTVTAPPVITTTAPTTAPPTATAASSTGPPSPVATADPHLDFVVPGVLGLPTVIDGATGTSVLAPVSGGLAVLDAASGQRQRTIAVDRGGYRGRVDVTALGSMIIEVRGNTVVGLRSS